MFRFGKASWRKGCCDSCSMYIYEGNGPVASVPSQMRRCNNRSLRPYPQIIAYPMRRDFVAAAANECIHGRKVVASLRGRHKSLIRGIYRIFMDSWDQESRRRVPRRQAPLTVRLATPVWVKRDTNGLGGSDGWPNHPLPYPNT